MVKKKTNKKSFYRCIYSIKNENNLVFPVNYRLVVNIEFLDETRQNEIITYFSFDLYSLVGTKP